MVREPVCQKSQELQQGIEKCFADDVLRVVTLGRPVKKGSEV